MPAATPEPKPNLEESSDDAVERVKKALARIREKAATGRLNGDSTLFKIKKKLTTMGSADDVERRRRYLEAANAEEETEEKAEA